MSPLPQPPDPAPEPPPGGGPADGPGVEPDGDPEHEGTRADRRYPSTIGGAFYLLVLLVAGASLFVAMAHDWRVGVRMLAAALGAAAGARLLLPERDAGMLAVRHRVLDVALLTAVAVTLWWLAGSIPDQPV